MKTFLFKLRRFNWLMFFAMVALIVVGVCFIYSASSWRQPMIVRNAYMAHAQIAAIGLVVYFALAFIDCRKILEYFAVPSYVAAVSMLVLVLMVGSTIYGGKRWLWFFQPSEIAKLSVILMLAAMLGARGFLSRLGERPLPSWLMLVIALVLLGVPTLLILKEPDLGTAMVLAPAGMMMLLASRVCTKGVLALLSIVAVVSVLLIGAIYMAEKQPSPEKRDQILAMTHLKPHQIKRLQVFLFPDKDIHGAGYNRRQAEISVGSGGWSGKGWTKGEHYLLGYLPQSVSMNDFIFAVLAEETGFVGSAVTLGLYLVILLSGLWAGVRCGDDGGRLVTIGVTTLIFCHVYVNMAMSIGLMPITGLPLPFISSGRTFMVVMMAALGIVQSITIHGGSQD